jgi:hypothetical protein
MLGADTNVTLATSAARQPRRPLRLDAETQTLSFDST